MEVICLKEEVFFSLIDKVVGYIKEKHGTKEDKWVSDEEAMRKLRITSRTTLQKFRDEGRVRFTQAFAFDYDHTGKRDGLVCFNDQTAVVQIPTSPVSYKLLLHGLLDIEEQREHDLQ